MRKFLTVVAFMVITVALFSGYSNYGIPQIEPAPPPVEEKLDLGSMTMDQFVALGGRLFEGKGTCTLCHNSLGRAPMLDQIGANAQERLDDPRYEGAAKDVEGYLIESLVEPSAFVVAGFGKAGSNDTESPMPSTSGGGIALSEPELAAVIAFLQDNGGLEITVEIPTDIGSETEEPDAAGSGEPRPAMTSFQELSDEFACEACHTIGEEAGDLGPNLSTIGASRDRDYIRRALLAPNADLAEGFDPDMMPADLGEQLYAGELELMVDYLSKLK
ncbi:MAG: c-type cytochrome [Rhodobacteraceae bacterium]|nr:c-type cytochrome [Paracoccaceae bacterium]